MITNTSYTSRICSNCSLFIIICGETQLPECSDKANYCWCFDKFYQCYYCDYTLCDDCQFHLTTKIENEINFSPKQGYHDVCSTCLKTKHICISCFTLSEGTSLERTVLDICEMCNGNVCAECKISVDNLHKTAKHILCFECADSFHDSRNLYLQSNVWKWFHDGCKKITPCLNCGLRWCRDHDHRSLTPCANLNCLERPYYAAYCKHCILDRYKNQNYCSCCVYNLKIVQRDVI